MAVKAYLRDGRAPIPVKESTSKVMRANKGKNTQPELLLRQALWDAGTKGYRLHWKKAPGRPDIAFPGKKVAVFVNGCYWHRCPHCDLPLPKNNQAFWKEKFGKNVARDKRKIKDLHAAGWEAITIWECEIKEDVAGCAKKIGHFLAG